MAMIRAAATMLGASALPAAVAWESTHSATEAMCPPKPQPMHVDDAVALVHTSAEFAMELEEEYARPTPAPTNRYVMVTKGTCEENGHDPIQDIEVCKEAAEELRLPKNNDCDRTEAPNRDPSGCLWKYNAHLLKLNDWSEGLSTGANVPFYILCFTVFHPTPAPTRGVCLGDERSYSTPWGDCASYAPGGRNDGHCNNDEDAVTRRTPAQVCTSCGECYRPTRPPTPNPTDEMRDRSPAPTPATCICAPFEDGPVCGVDGRDYTQCEAGCQRVPVECTGNCPCGPTATGDPHVSNLAGERFDVKKPATHVLLRVPLDPSQPALLELRGQIEADKPTSACAMYIRMVTLHGGWLGNSSVQVRALRRNKPGSNDAGTTIAWPFSLHQSNASADGDWKSVADFGSGRSGVEIVSASVSVAARARTEEFGSGPASQAFEFLVGGGAMSPASIIVMQGQRQSLNLQLKNLESLGERRLGGLLGTEKHSREVEEETEECKASRTSIEYAAARFMDRHSFWLSASW